MTTPWIHHKVCTTSSHRRRRGSPLNSVFYLCQAHQLPSLKVLQSTTSLQNDGYDPEILKVEIKEEEEVSDDCESKDKNPAIKYCSKIREDRKKKHASEKNRTVKCKICAKSFCNKFSLERHKWSHDKKPLTCDYCDKILTNQESFLRHVRMHASGNPFQCSSCDKSYVSRGSYEAHIRKHTGERPFKCSECDETFSLMSSYERHVAKHRGVKDYKCEICDSSFWVPDDLRAHVNRMH